MGSRLKVYIFLSCNNDSHQGSKSNERIVKLIVNPSNAEATVIQSIRMQRFLKTT